MLPHSIEQVLKLIEACFLLWVSSFLPPFHQERFARCFLSLHVSIARTVWVESPFEWMGHGISDVRLHLYYLAAWRRNSDVWISYIRRAVEICCLCRDWRCGLSVWWPFIIIWLERSSLAGNSKSYWSCNMCRKQRVGKGVKTKNKQNW